ncbi:hypothetical protein [Natrarchaeobaculum sulfurireducens]|uniref:Uncharacterized protein n=1 Tax=Natrarchaeobaculum sulfurireducens TaxID=2044521 RepID=A0A346PN83_9EURY|nr:hypothetical protein [Natrarchaeobaculum sulfurireducens]AXR80978.1 hypothetical protein AArcMg_0960 [Natrarchaeobaculum sulfurireducens]
MSEAVEADDTTVAGALEGEQATPIPRSFLVEGSGPVTVVRDHGDVTERTEGEVTIAHRLETLEAFAEFWALRGLRNWKRNAIRTVLEAHEDDVRYVITDDQLEAWDVQVDGRAQAFIGVAETMLEEDVTAGSIGTDDQRFAGYLANATDKDVDELTLDLARDLKRSPLWGPGAKLAELTIRHANRDDLEGYVEALLEEVDA